MPFEVLRVPVWTDNYAWVLARGGRAAVVDSPEAGPILALLEQRGLRLTHVLNTHHHPDHVGANAALAEAVPGLQVWAGRVDAERGRIPALTRAFDDGERFELLGAAGTVRDLPGHTLGHVGWFFDDGRCFVGDTLFAGGCGRLFEGTAEQLDRSLNEVIGALPDGSLVYCAHEYTAANLAFARSVEPGNEALARRSESVAAARARGEATVPSTLGEERATNPFLRCDLPALRAAAGLGPEAARHRVLGALRAMKDGFRP